MKYKLFHKVTNEPLGQASSIQSLGELLIDLLHDDNIFPSQVRIEEVDDDQGV